MRKLAEFFKNRVVISIIGLVVVSLLIWFIGPELKFGANNYAPFGSETIRLVGIMVVIILWGLNNLRVAYRDKKNNDGLVSDLQQNQSNSKNIISEQTSEEMHVIGERFADALATLRKLKFKAGKGRKALYELPWYIIIGPPGSGKTTALVHSSLEFPLAEKYGKEALQGVGGTRNCDWWFTNEAVLIDTAGRYTTQDSHKVIDSSSWDGFLGLLKKHRRRRPINGAIIAISLQELLTQTEEERATHARTIRTRIDELMSKLEIRFPIYLMLTKTDLVSGFTEYFEELNKEDREQVWGVSLPNSVNQAVSPDFDCFEQEYDRLTKRLYAGLIQRIHQERDAARRGLIQAFPQQVDNIKVIISQFVRQAFVKNRYQYQPYLRGIYFTSGTQDGMPIDRLMSSVSTNFGFNREVMSTGMGMGKSFFLGKLFRDVIFPESELVGSNRKYEYFIKWTQRAVYLSLAAISASMITIWAGSFTRNEMYMHQVEGLISEYGSGKKNISRWSTDPRSIVPVLNTLRAASTVYDKNSHPWLSGLGMYDASVDDAAKLAYQSELIKLYLPFLLKSMESYLSAGQQAGDLYDNFRAYLMFNKLEHLDKQYVTDWFSKHWSNQYNGNQVLIRDLVNHLGDLLGLPLKPAKLNGQLVDKIRYQLMQMPIWQRIYNGIRTNPLYSEKVNLLSQFGDAVRTDFSTNESDLGRLSIPVLFTAQAYKSIDLSPKSELIAGFTKDNWIMSDGRGGDNYLQSVSLEKISDNVKNLYFAEYNSYWENVYRSLKMMPFQNIRQANDVLQNLVDPVYSPLLAVLNIGVANTTLTNPVMTDAAEGQKDNIKGKAVGFLASQVKLTAVDKQFGELNAMMRERANKPPKIQNAVSKIRQLQEFVNGILVAPDPGQKAFEIAKARYLGGGENAISSLMSYAQTAPQPLNRWLQTLASETWKVILGTAHGYISSQWQEQVYNPCNAAMSGRYPIAIDSNEDVSMTDFSEYFKPGGTVDKFNSAYIKPFVNISNGWSSKSLDHYSMAFSSNAIGQIRKAQLIKNIYFHSNPGSPSLSFQMRPDRMNKTDERFVMEYGDKRISYSHGPKFWTTFKWTGAADNGRIRMYFEDLSGKQHSVAYEGPWAFFRLQDQAKLSRMASSNTFLATYHISDGSASELAPMTRDSRNHWINYEIKPSSINNPFDKNLLGSFRCVSRI